MNLLQKQSLTLLMLASFFALIFYQPIRASETSQITATITVTICGDDIVGTGEDCDNDNLNSKTCTSLGYGGGGTLTCRADCTFNVSECLSGNPNAGSGISGGGGGSTALPSVPTETKVLIKGLAYPGALVNILKDGEIIEKIETKDESSFQSVISPIQAGTYTFSVWALDQNQRRSSTFSFTLNVAKNVITTISDIVLPPTVELEASYIQQNADIDLKGNATPQSEVLIEIHSQETREESTQTKSTGIWQAKISSLGLALGSHVVRAKTMTADGLESNYSEPQIFSLGKEASGLIGGKGDLDGDKAVNLADFSILLYNWGVAKNPLADFNKDGKVDLTDFSIMLFYWTG